MEKVVAEVDEKGRILIPKRVRRELNIEPLSKIRLRIEGVIPKKSFTEVAKGSLKGAGDAVELLHRESPFR